MAKVLTELLYDGETEAALLGCCLLDGRVQAEVASLVTGEDFYARRHRLIWEAYQRLALDGEPIDLLTTRKALEAAGALEEAGGLSALVGLTEGVPTTLHARAYAQTVARLAARRRLFEAAGQIAGIAQETEDADEALAAAERALLGVRRTLRTGRVLTPQERASQMLEFLTRMREGVPAGLPYGFPWLDRATGGAQPGQLVLVGGRPSVGKSTFLQTVAENMAAAGHRVLYATIEMPDRQLVARTLAWEAKVNLQTVLGGGITAYSYERLVAALGTVADLPLYVYDDSEMTTSSLLAVASEAKLRFGIEAIFLDYAQLLADEAERGENTVAKYTRISRRLKSIARVLEVPLIAGSQLSRSVEERGDAPRLSDLRETGGWEQDSDVVLFLHRVRQSKEERRAGLPDKTQLIVGKNRNGPSGGYSPLVFSPKMTRFLPPADQEDADFE